MPTPTLAPNATLADVAGTLLKPDDYVRIAYFKMKELEKEHGPLVLRIGIMGTGKVPHYRFDELSRSVIFDREHIHSIPVAAFNGRNHEPLVPEGEEPDILHERNWSTRGLNFADIEDVFRKIRGITR